MLCNMPTYVLVPESFVHNPKLLSLLCYFGPTHCFSLEALNSQIEKGRGPKIFAREARELQHLPPLNPGYATVSHAKNRRIHRHRTSVFGHQLFRLQSPNPFLKGHSKFSVRYLIRFSKAA